MAAKKKSAKKKASTKKAPPAKKPAAKKTSTKKPVAKKVAAKAPAASSKKKELGETLLRAITVAIIADGEIAEAEERLLNRLAKAPLFKDLNGPKIVAATIKQVIVTGPDRIFAEIAEKLTTKDERETAFASCLAATTSDGKLTASEVRMLHALKDAFSLSTARAKALAGPAAAIFS